MYVAIAETNFALALQENAFYPNVFVDISEYFELKMRILSIFKSEIMPDNLPRSSNAIKALSEYRGSSICVQYSEAFMLLYEKC